jgi:hypothetical protein
VRPGQIARGYYSFGTNFLSWKIVPFTIRAVANENFPQVRETPVKPRVYHDGKPPAKHLPTQKTNEETDDNGCYDRLCFNAFPRLAAELSLASASLAFHTRLFRRRFTLPVVGRGLDSITTPGPNRAS